VNAPFPLEDSVLAAYRDLSTASNTAKGTLSEETISMAFGDHIYVRRVAYTHDGIDCGDETVIHRSSADGGKSGAMIRRSSIEEFSCGAEIQVRDYGARLSREETMARAESAVGQSGYHLIFDNCEHFARWCATGEYESEQVQVAVSATGVAGLGIGVPAGGLRVVTTLGSGAARSAPNLMSGLVRLGGSTTAGLFVMAGAVGVTTTWGMVRLMPDKPYLTEEERVARRNGRYGAAAGAAAGTALGLHAVGAMGVAGYSAAGISSGLAALGSTIGGGMAMGVSLAIALPAILAAALGYAIYRLSQAWVADPIRPTRELPS
jgi:hypothetical protein